MKKIIILMVCLWGLGNTFTSAQTTEKEKFISSLMKQMTLDEKIGQLAQCTYRGNFTGPDGGNIPKEEYVRQGRIGSAHECRDRSSDIDCAVIKSLLCNRVCAFL